MFLLLISLGNLNLAFSFKQGIKTEDNVNIATYSYYNKDSSRTTSFTGHVMLLVAAIRKGRLSQIKKALHYLNNNNNNGNFSF